MGRSSNWKARGHPETDRCRRGWRGALLGYGRQLVRLGLWLLPVVDPVPRPDDELGVWVRLHTAAAGWDGAHGSSKQGWSIRQQQAGMEHTAAAGRDGAYGSSRQGWSTRQQQGGMEHTAAAGRDGAHGSSRQGWSIRQQQAGMEHTAAAGRDGETPAPLPSSPCKASPVALTNPFQSAAGSPEADLTRTTMIPALAARDPIL